MLFKNLAKGFGKMSLGKRNEKLCWHSSTIFMSVVLNNSFMRNLLVLPCSQCFPVRLSLQSQWYEELAHVVIHIPRPRQGLLTHGSTFSAIKHTENFRYLCVNAPNPLHVFPRRRGNCQRTTDLSLMLRTCYGLVTGNWCNGFWP